MSLPTNIFNAVWFTQKIAEMKNKLQEYWVNELQLPMEIQLKSFAIIDMVIEDEK